MNFIKYCIIRVPRLIAVGCALYVLINDLFPEKRSAWFNSLSVSSRVMLYFVLAVVAGILAIISCHIKVD